MEVRFQAVTVNGVRLNVAQAGPESGPLLLLLHGFPEFWYGWRAQIPALAAAGYRVWLPDQRGYNLSAKPSAVRDYGLDHLAADVVGLIEAAGVTQARLVGHDWGAAVAWWVATRHPERLSHLAILNVPHPWVMRRHLQRQPRQLLRSWYMLFFQPPALPEALLRAHNFAGMVRLMVASSAPGTFSEEALERYRRAWQQPGALTAMLHWYRAVIRYALPLARAPRITVPTLILWGARDIALDRELAPASAALCDDVQLRFFEQASHWLQHEEAAQVNAALLDFLA